MSQLGAFLTNLMNPINRNHESEKPHVRDEMSLIPNTLSRLFTVVHWIGWSPKQTREGAPIFFMSSLVWGVAVHWQCVT